MNLSTRYLSLNVIHCTVKILTRSCIIGKRTERLNIPANNFCRTCGSDEGKEKTVFHLIYQYPVLVIQRWSLFITQSLISLTNIKTAANTKCILDSLFVFL